jgi:sialate O-acetylesterase
MKRGFLAVLFVGLVVGVIYLDRQHTARNRGLRLPDIFGDHMVLQRNQPVVIWGWDNPGQSVTVRFAEQEHRTETDAEGRWKVLLQAMSADAEPHALAIRGSGQVKIRDVLVGDVWLCSGQSNMEWGVNQIDDARAVIAHADVPGIRLAWVQRNTEDRPSDEAEIVWKPCHPTEIQDIGNAGFSAVAYFFGRSLHDNLKIPIGLVQSTYGNTPCEAWVSRESLQALPDAPALMKRAEVLAEEKSHHAASYLFNAMIHPLVGYNLRGVIWYQGEANISNPGQYEARFETLIRDWRFAWGREPDDMPFGFVQLPPFRYEKLHPAFKHNLVVLQQAQANIAQRVQAAGMVVTTDAGDPDHIHPTNKEPVGRRLAQWALGAVYEQDPGYQGLLIEEVTFRKAQAFVRCNSESLKTNDGAAPKGFFIAGKDRQFVSAQAELADGQIRVWHDDIPAPVALRFAWNTGENTNLVNEQGNPPPPYRSDVWEPPVTP